MPLSVLKTFMKLLLGRGSFRSYGQFGEDAVVGALLRQRRGVYVDVGAYHPCLYSNTYALYRRGWYGVAIDPNADMGPLFRIFRPRDTFVCAGVGTGDASYQRQEDGAYNSFIKGVGSPLRSLASILKEHGVQAIDFLSIDVEGLDLDVLQTMDWQIRPTVIVVESAMGSEVQRYVEAQGYELKGVAGASLIFKVV